MCHHTRMEVSRQLLGVVGSKDRAEVARLGSEHLTPATSVDGGGLSSQRRSSLHSEPQAQGTGDLK